MKQGWDFYILLELESEYVAVMFLMEQEFKSLYDWYIQKIWLPTLALSQFITQHQRLNSAFALKLITTMQNSPHSENSVTKTLEKPEVSRQSLESLTGAMEHDAVVDLVL